jgi:membrane glycosyltransferase
MTSSTSSNPTRAAGLAATPTPQHLARAAQRRYTHAAAPALQRGSMVPTPWRGFWASLADHLQGRSAPAAEMPAQAWQAAAAHRRHALLALVLLCAAGATALLLQSQPAAQGGMLRWLQVGLFSLLFAWVAAGCITAVMGYFSLRRGDRHGLRYADVARHAISADARTAVIMPICNENVGTVFAGLSATAESLVASGGARLVEFYVLSDTADNTLRASERQAWTALRDRFADTGLRVHYRWRARRTQRKAGNVADFCRRWGQRHRYMVVLDADSVMSGEAVLGLVRLMEATPQAGIIQSAPITCGLDTLHARTQQFAGRVTGRLFGAGMQYWQLGESHYWGHNAIIRVAPFMAHCALAPLQGRGGLSGHILSHDFVEAALMRRAGWQTWLVPDLPGSWEQQPPHLLAELQRDRRWCQGNLQNARLMAEPGLHGVHRAMFFTGAMAYLSAPLWLGFVVVGLVLWLTEGHSLISAAQVLNGGPLAALWAATLALLMLPRALGVALVLREGQQAQYGGTAALLGSALLEALMSALQAPVRMAAHTVFVVGALTGLQLKWKSPPREAERLRWRDAAPALLPLSLLAGAALAVAVVFGSHHDGDADAGALLWLLPVALPLLAAWPVAVWAGRPSLGRALRRAGLLLTPEEVLPAPALQRAWANAWARAAPGNQPYFKPVQLA